MILEKHQGHLAMEAFLIGIISCTLEPFVCCFALCLWLTIHANYKRGFAVVKAEVRPQVKEVMPIHKM